MLYTRLFQTFKKQYKIKGKIYYTDFWIWEEKKEQQKYQMTKFQQVGLQGSENIFIYDQADLKARQTKGDDARQKLIDLFNNLKSHG